jgi:hypothetical protein
MPAAGGLFKVTITEKNYDGTVYTTWVSAQSKAQALLMGAALAGQEKCRDEYNRRGRDPGNEGLTLPEATMEPCSVDEFYQHETLVEVSTYATRSAAKTAAKEVEKGVES